MRIPHPDRGTSPDDLLALFFGQWQPAPRIENVATIDACGRRLAADQFARFDVPQVRAAGMDGVALRSSDFYDGMPDTSSWERGDQWDFADMGDDFDDRFDMIVPVEMARVENGRIALDLDETPQAGCCVRPVGSTVRKGRLILEKGAVLRRTEFVHGFPRISWSRRIWCSSSWSMS